MNLQRSVMHLASKSKSTASYNSGSYFGLLSHPEIAIHKKYPNGITSRNTLCEANSKRLLNVF
jgi:hypothetical protein